MSTPSATARSPRSTPTSRCNAHPDHRYDAAGIADAGARRLLRHLSVFAGGWTVEAVEAISPVGVDALTGLTTLAGQSLVQREDGPASARFRMLEMVRAFALEQLLHDDASQVAYQQHAEFFLDLAERLDSRQAQLQPVSLDQVAVEHDNPASLRESLVISLQPDDLRAVAYTMEGMAAAHASRSGTDAAWFAGLAAKIREESGRLLPAIEVGWRHRHLEPARLKIDDDSWNATWAAGHAAPYELAMQHALGNAEAFGLPDPAPATPVLSPRELEVLRLLVDGRSNQEIAGLLFISHRTVASHVESILNQLVLESRTAAATWAVRNGLA